MTAQILVPLDGSRLAEQALPCAMMLARTLPAELIFLRIASIPADVEGLLDGTEATVAAVKEELTKEATIYLTDVADRFQDRDVSLHWSVRHGPAAETILEYARETGVETIVMATHGYTGVRRWVHGSVAERVLQSADLPVLLVRAQEDQEAAYQPMACRRILIPLDGSAVAEQVLPPAVAMAKALEATVVLLQVPIVYVFGSFMGEWYLPLQGVIETAHEEAQTYLDRIADRVGQQGIDLSTTLQVGSVADCIIDYAEANQIDLIAMCTHGRTGLQRWTLGSVADRVLRAGTKPVLLVRAHEREQA